ncbi:MOSC domain-containing protein [Rhodoferax mekongensis]|uniref:MOSC domain-containing protein n=1 Tax=Rhodoferax mekongensis TaxID=3068341 RepID=UPI0028BD1EFA|nr:MOSC N-terminal beta barrel domain-containing protein [Rhodoferax sp. TBRC 17199]MDT7516673.1 MOSC N-terminal beta barrel domain-containing protein [Rhodoferax sp. TBRC 17199]
MSDNFTPDVHGRIAALMIYPVKSLAGISVTEARLLETGLEWDRHWMVVDAGGLFLTQRECPRMALVQPRITPGALELHGPEGERLVVPLQAPGPLRRVQVWDDTLDALDMGKDAALWLQQVLGEPGVRLVRFAPQVQRPCSTRWTGGAPSHTEFADGYPVLVTTEASMDPLNARLAAAGLAPVGINRFRPNLVLGGLDAHDEDHLTVLEVEMDAERQVRPRLALVKPCARCPIPNIDPVTAQTHPGVGDALMAYRQDARVNGAITFGMNAIVQAGAGAVLRVGQSVAASYGFE